MTLTPGQHVERYEVLRLLGEGGMAAVYLVRHRQLGSLHALKVLTLDRADVRERLLQEGRVQANLDHDGAVAVTDVVDVMGAPGLILEYVDGPSLEAWLQQGTPPLTLRLDVFRQVVATVAAAHAAGLVHRDLKPANVLLTLGAAGPRAKVTDFGLVKILEGSSSARATRSGTIMGTPAYMAPEQMKDSASVDARADVFALGAMLYELVTGQVPHGEGSVVETWDRATRQVRRDPKELTPDVPPAVLATLEACLQVDPQARPSDAQAVLDLLDAGAARMVPPSSVGSASVRASPVHGASKRAVWTVSASVVGLAVVLATALGLLCMIGAVTGFLRAVAADPNMPCQPGAVGTVGYARASRLFLPDQGDTWSPQRSVRVYRAVPDDGSAEESGQVCVLPAGSRVELVEPPVRKGRNTWVRVERAHLTLPE